MKIGIKTYTDKKGYEYISKVIGFVDFVEILPLPDDGLYKKFRNFGIPFRIHAPHQAQGADPADKKAAKRTMECMKTAIEAADLFESPTIVVHPGSYQGPGGIMQAIDFLKQFNDKRFLIENLPAEVHYKGELGSRAAEIKQFLDALKCGMCLDFGHAALTEHSRNVGYKQVINEFMELNPEYFHMSGGSIKDCTEHYNLFYGDFDIAFFRKCLPKNALLVLETPHNAEMQKKEIRFIKEGAL